VRFGVGPESTWRVTDLVDDGRVRFTVREDGKAALDVTLRVPGAINARNALGVMLVARECGVGLADAAAALAEFHGVARRQEVVGEGRGVTVIDDFAHHPTAVAETLAALRLRYPGRRLRAVFEPRSNTSRRRVFQDEFVSALARHWLCSRPSGGRRAPIPAPAPRDPRDRRRRCRAGTPAR
jgi:UDP-N-acetylmuramate: L-alanyl-gamma-D-glutamyl-meso-diaminopimelate ligase